MPAFNNLTGHQFGRLIVIERDIASKYTSWICKCLCNNTVSIRSCHLVNGGTKSCGCILKELLADRNTTHGQSGSSEYNSWSMMKNRCINPNTNNYHRYGERSIKVCDQWIESFENFYADMGSKPSSDHSIERLNNDGNYEPGNCVWATKLEQAQNRSNNRIIEDLNGNNVTIMQASRDNNINEATIRFRLNNGMSTNEALTKPTQELYYYNGLNLSLVEWGNRFNISNKLIYSRIHTYGWSIERAITTPVTKYETNIK